MKVAGITENILNIKKLEFLTSSHHQQPESIIQGCAFTLQQKLTLVRPATYFPVLVTLPEN